MAITATVMLFLATDGCFATETNEHGVNERPILKLPRRDDHVRPDDRSRMPKREIKDRTNPSLGHRTSPRPQPQTWRPPFFWWLVTPQDPWQMFVQRRLLGW